MLINNHIENNHAFIISIAFSLLYCIFTLASCASINEKSFNYNDIRNYLYNPDEDDLVYIYSFKNGNIPYRNLYHHYHILKNDQTVNVHIDIYDDLFNCIGYNEFTISDNNIVFTKMSSVEYKDDKFIVHDGKITKNSYINNSFTTTMIAENNSNKESYNTFTAHLVKQSFTDKDLQTPAISCLEVQFKNTITFNRPGEKCIINTLLTNTSFLYKKGPVYITNTNLQNNGTCSYFLRETITFNEFLNRQKK